MQAKAIAATFSRNLREMLTEDEMTEVIERNRELIDSTSCASHDFCDANEPMAEAFGAAGIDFDVSDDRHLALWGQAWEIAVRAEFSVQ